MTYLELANESAHDLDRGKITLGEYEERIKPLCDEIKPWNGWISTSERFPERFALVLFSVNFGLVEEGFYMGQSGKGLQATRFIVMMTLQHGNRSQIRIMQKVRINNGLQPIYNRQIKRNVVINI